MVGRPGVLSQSLTNFMYRLSVVYQKSLNVSEQNCIVYLSKVWIQLTPKLLCAIYNTAVPLSPNTEQAFLLTFVRTKRWSPSTIPVFIQPVKKAAARSYPSFTFLHNCTWLRECKESLSTLKSVWVPRTPSPEQPFSFLGQLAVIGTRQLFRSVRARVSLCCLWQYLADSEQCGVGLQAHLCDLGIQRN